MLLLGDHVHKYRRVIMRGTARGGAKAAAIALVAVLAGCGQGGGQSVTDGKAAASRARAQLVPAARELYQTLFHASARSVTVLDGAYVSCEAGKSTLSYAISLRLFPFTDRQDTDFDAYQNRVVTLVRGDGWTLRSRPGRMLTTPSVPSAYYWLSKREGKLTISGTLGLYGDQKPSVGVGGTISVNSPCFDAHGAAADLRSQTVESPLPLPTTSPTGSH